MILVVRFSSYTLCWFHLDDTRFPLPLLKKTAKFLQQLLGQQQLQQSCESVYCAFDMKLCLRYSRGLEVQEQALVWGWASLKNYFW